MAVESTLVPLGTPAPDFSLPTVGGSTVSLRDLTAPVLVVAFVCNHCPYVKHVEHELGRLADELLVSGCEFVAICSNDAVSYPDDAPAHLREQAERAGWGFPYLVDESQQVARDYGAVCTPDFFAYGPDRTLVYRGAMDGSTPGNGVPVDASLLRSAVVRILAGEAVPEPHRPSLGCSIKWRDQP
jgi:peroxiredoxin